MEIFLTKPEASGEKRSADLDLRMMSPYLCLALAEKEENIRTNKYMIYLTFDSNIWVYLLDNSWTASNPLDHLEHWLKEKHIKILVPDIVISEWNNIKEKQRQIRIKKIREFFNMAQEIIPTGFIEEHNKPENLARIVEDQFKRIENLIYSLCDTITIEDAVRLRSVQWGLEKFAPMHKKNSVADTLIVLSMIEFASLNPGNDYYFISNNLDDFYERNPDRIHRDLKKDFDLNNIKEYRFLEPVIDELKKSLPISVDIAALKKDRIKVKLEQQIYNPAVFDLLSGTKDGYLENINSLDMILTKETPTTQQVLFVLNLIESDDSYAYYFFKNCTKLVWFQLLIDRGTFQPHHNLTPVKIDKGYTIPLWSPMMYLLTISGDSTFIKDSSQCKQLTNILEEICKNPKDNDRTWYFIIQILEKLPNEFVPESILEYIPVWLSGTFDNSVVSSLLCKELLNKFYSENPNTEDHKKAGIIIKHLFSLRNSPETVRSNTKPGEYYSLVYLYFLSGIPMDENIIKQMIAGSSDWVIGYMCENLKKLLLDYPEGIKTTIHESQSQYEVEAVIDNKDVVINSKIKGTNSTVQSTRLSGFLEAGESSFTQTMIEVLKKQGITYNAEENKDYNLESLRVRLYHGKSYSMDSVPIHKLEDSDEHEDDLVSLFSLILTKLLLEYGRQLPSKSQDLLKSVWDEYRLPLFKRIVLYIIGQNWSLNRLLFTQIATDEWQIFSTHDFEKEIYFLLRNNAGNYSTQEKDLFKTIIKKGPLGVSAETDLLYIEHWKFQWYAALKSEPEFEQDYQTLSKQLNTTEVRLENMGESVLRSGSVSPFSTEEILKKSNEEIVNFILNFKPPDRWAEPNIEGMAERLGKAVETEPNHFAAQMHLYKGVYYIYIYYMLNGFREAWKKKLAFDWEKLITFCSEYINQVKYSTGELKLSIDSWGANDEWVAGSVATLFTSGMQSDDQAFDASLLPTVKAILSKLTAELEIPKEIRRDNMDYPTYSLNSTAGKVLRALFDYSLRRARSFFKIEDPGKWEPEIKMLFEQSIQKGLIDGYILQGMYFQHFYYLDKDWITKQIVVNFDVEESQWEAFMGGFVFGRAPNSKEIYLSMYPHYERAIQKQMEFSKMNERTIVRHLVSFYFWGFEKLEEQKLVYQFLQKSSAEAVRDFIGFMSRQVAYYKTLEGEEKVKFEEMISEVWKMVVERFRNATTDEDKKTLSATAGLLSLAPVLNSEVTQLILVSIKDMTEYYHWHGVIDDLIAFSEKENNIEIASNVGKILLKSTALPLHTSYESNKLRLLVIYLYENSQKDTANQICDTISRQGPTFLRDVYDKYNNQG